MKGKFIITKDVKTANILDADGFTLFSSNDGIYTFLNNKNLEQDFTEYEWKTMKTTFTDRLFV